MRSDSIWRDWFWWCALGVLAFTFANLVVAVVLLIVYG